MTYNILDGGRDGRDFGRLSAIFSVIEAERPDVLLLNECHLFDLDGHALRYELERRLSLCSVFAPAAHTGHHLTLFLPRDVLHRAYVEQAGFHHAMVRAVVSLKSRTLTVLGCHLCPWSGDVRCDEVRRLIGAAPASEDLLLLGDLNAVSPRDVPYTRPEAWPARYRARHLLSEGALDTRALSLLDAAGWVDLLWRAQPDRFHPTRPTALGASAADAAHARPAQRLDYIYATPAVARRLVHCRVADSELAQRASDHLPVVAELDLHP